MPLNPTDPLLFSAEYVLALAKDGSLDKLSAYATAFETYHGAMCQAIVQIHNRKEALQQATLTISRQLLEICRPEAVEAGTISAPVAMKIVNLSCMLADSTVKSVDA